MRKLSLLVSCGLIISILTGCNKMQPEDILNNQKENLYSIHQVSFREIGLILNNKGEVVKFNVPVCVNGKVDTDYVKYVSSICNHDDEDFILANYSIVESNPTVPMSKQFQLKDYEQIDADTLVSATDLAIKKGTKVLHVSSNYLRAFQELDEFNSIDFVGGDTLPIVDDYEDEEKYLKGIPISKNIEGFKYTFVKPGDGIDSTSTMLKDGSVTSQRIVRSFNDTLNSYVTAVRNITGQNFDKFYKNMKNDSMGVFLGYCGDYTLAVKSINFNTQEMYIGYGKEARLNIIMELNDRVVK